MADPVIGIYPEAKADQKPLYAAQFVHRCQVDGVLVGRTDALLITPHQRIGATIHQNDGIWLKLLHKRLIGRQHRLNPLFLDGVDPARFTLPPIPAIRMRFESPRAEKKGGCKAESMSHYPPFLE